MKINERINLNRIMVVGSFYSYLEGGTKDQNLLMYKDTSRHIPPPFAFQVAAGAHVNKLVFTIRWKLEYYNLITCTVF